MKKIVAFNGSPRPAGNTTHLLKKFIEGARQNDVEPEIYYPHQLNLNYCTGCLRCNVLRRCSIAGDDWSELSSKILEADVLVFATPVYFHHVPAPMKLMMDRFRSFINVQITKTGLIHTPWQKWDKDFVLILSMGSSDVTDADPIIDLFRFITSILGAENKLHVISATRLAVIRQVIKDEGELSALYNKMNLAPDLAKADSIRNSELLDECLIIGRNISKG